MLKVCFECHGSYTNENACCGHKRVFRAASTGGGFLYEKGEIPTSRKKRKEVARWSSEGEGGNRKIYVNCIFCGSVDEVSDHGFTAHDGVAAIRNCIVCERCERHYWVTLEGWTYGNMAADYGDDEEAGEENDNYDVDDDGGDDDA